MTSLSSIIKLGKNLELGVIIEGVETQEQLDFLIQFQNLVVQGFYLGRPLKAHQMTQLLTEFFGKYAE